MGREQKDRISTANAITAGKGRSTTSSAKYTRQSQQDNQTVVPVVVTSRFSSQATNTSFLGTFGDFLFGDRRHHHHSKTSDSHHQHDGSNYNYASMECRANRLSAINFDCRVYTFMSVWRQHRLKVLAYNYLASSATPASSTSPSPTLPSSSTNRISIQRLDHQLYTYENIERVELLKLAVWKSQCLLLFPSGKYRSYLDMAEWKEIGWMSQKDRVFGISVELVDTVAAGVLPFLTGQKIAPTTTVTVTVTATTTMMTTTRARSRDDSHSCKRGRNALVATSRRDDFISFAGTSSAASSVSVLAGRHGHEGCGAKRKRGHDDDHSHEHGPRRLSLPTSPELESPRST